MKSKKYYWKCWLKYYWETTCFYVRVLMLLPVQLVIWATFVTFVARQYQFEIFRAIVAFTCLILLIVLAIRVFPWARHALVWYVKFLSAGCPPEVRSACEKLEAACEFTDRRSHGEFRRRFETARMKVREGSLAALLRGARIVLWLILPLLVLSIVRNQGYPAPFQQLRNIGESETLELGASIGTLFVAFTAFLKLKDQTMASFKSCILILGCVALAVGCGIYAITYRPQIWYHLWAVFVASILLGLYDCVALYGARTQKYRKLAERSPGSVSGEKRHAWMEFGLLFVIVDAPMIVASLAVVLYFEAHMGPVDSRGKWLLAGALTMQFLNSAILFALIEEGIIEKVFGFGAGLRPQNATPISLSMSAAKGKG